MVRWQPSFKRGALTTAAVLLACAPVFTTVSAKSEQRTNTEPLSFYLGHASAYKTPVSMTIGWWSSTPTGLPSGDTQQSNLYVKYIEKKLNVRLQWSFIEPGTELQTKENLSIADGDMPDVMVVNRQQLLQLEQTNQLADLTTAYKDNASGYLKEIYASNDNRSLQAATFNGHLMAIPDTQIGYQWNELWIRKDWLDKLHLAPPKSLADVEHIAKEFIAHHMGGAHTVGLVGLPTLTQYNGTGGFDTVFGDFGAYPGNWITVHGKVEYGSVQPQMIAALKALHQMYAEGLIDPQFATRTNEQEMALLGNGQSGMTFGPWWAPYSPLYATVETNPKADWVPYDAPIDAQGKMNVIAPPWTSNYIVVKKGFAHPDAVVKILNLDQAGLRDYNPATNNFYKGSVPNWGVWPLLIQLDDYNAVPLQYKALQAALRTHSSAQLPPRDVAIYQSILKNKADGSDPAKSIADWENAWSYTTGLAPLVNEKLFNQIEPLTVVLPQEYAARWSQMQKIESQTLLQIVVGQEPVSQFNTFVSEWNALGGTQITQYVQQHLKEFQ